MDPPDLAWLLPVSPSPAHVCVGSVAELSAGQQGSPERSAQQTDPPSHLNLVILFCYVSFPLPVP